MKKRLICLLLILSLAASLPMAAHAVPLPGEASVEIVISPEWEDAGDFHEGLARVFDGKKWGYIASDGSLAVDCVWDIASDFNEGLAAVATVEPGVSAQTPDIQTWHFIDRQGKIVRTVGTNEAYYFDSRAFLTGVSDGTYLTAPGGENTVFVHSIRGEASLPVRSFRSGTAFRGGYAVVSAAADGAFTLPPALQKLVGVLDDDAMPDVVIDYAGKVYWDGDWGMILAVDGGLVVYNSRATGLWGIDTLDGKEVVAPTISDLWYTYQNGVFSVFSGAYATVCINDSFCAVDQNGTLYPFDADGVGRFSEGLFPFDRDNVYGYCAVDGAVVIAAKYLTAEPFSCGAAVVSTANGYYYIDKSGANLNLFAYAEAHSLSEGLGRVKIDGKYGFVALSGRPADAAGDTPHAWAAAEVTEAYENGLIPDEFCCLYLSEATRSELARLSVTLLTRLRRCSADELVLMETGKTLDSFVAAYPFPDTSDRSVLAAYALGIINGYVDGTYRPDGLVTRAEAAKMLTVTAQLAGLQTSTSPLAFADSGSVAVWARDYVAFVSAAGIMNGVGGNRFDPFGLYTREQAYLTMNRIYTMAAE